MIECVRAATRCYIESHRASGGPHDVGSANAGRGLQHPLHVRVIGQTSDTVDFDQDLGLRLRERSALRGRQHVDRAINAGSQWTAPALAREIRVQRPLVLPRRCAGVRAADQYLVPSVTLSGVEHRVASDVRSIRVDNGKGNHTDEQTTRSGFLLESRARGVAISAAGWWIKHNQREGTLGIPDTPSRSGDRAVNGYPVKDDLRFAARPGRIGLNILRRVLDQARQGRIIRRFATPGGADERLAHGFLECRCRLATDIDFVDPDGPRSPSRTGQHAEKDQTEKETAASAVDRRCKHRGDV